MRAKRCAAYSGGVIQSSRITEKEKKRNMKKSVLSLALVLTLVVSLFAGLAVTANAADTGFPDTVGHWAHD